MALRPTRTEIYGDELVRALRSDRDGLVDGIAKACRKAVEGRPLTSLLYGVPRPEADALVRRGGAARIAVLSEHPDGRVRQQAVESLRKGGTEALPPLLRRVNDWVVPVANAALAGVQERFGQASDADLRAMVPLVFLLSRSQRGRSAEAVSAFLREAARRPHLARHLRHHAAADVARWLYSALRGSDETEEDVLRQALSSGDPGIVGWAAIRAARHPNLGRLFFASRSARLRRLALDFAPSEFIEAALVDPNAGVRNDARYLAEKRYFPEYYRTRLPALGAISGLGETGTANQAELLRPFLSDSRAEIRRRAVESFARLKGDDAEPELWIALSDPSRKVQCAAAKALVLSNVALERETLLDADLAPSVLLPMLRRGARWPTLIAVLRRADSLPWASSWLDGRAARLQSAQISPTLEQIEAFGDALTAAESFLRPATLAAFREETRFWRSRLS